MLQPIRHRIHNVGLPAEASFGTASDPKMLLSPYVHVAVPAYRVQLARITALFLASIGDEIAFGPALRSRDIMCDQCRAIDIQIQRYLWLETQLSDPRTLRGLAAQIEILETKRAALHLSIDGPELD